MFNVTSKRKVRKLFVCHITSFNMKGRKDVHTVRRQNAEPPVGEVGGHEPGHALDHPHRRLRVRRSGHPRLAGRPLGN